MKDALKTIVFSAVTVNVIAFFFIAVGLSACGQFDRNVSKWTGQPSEVCVSGVTYLQFTSGASVKVDRDGKPVPCKG